MEARKLPLVPIVFGVALVALIAGTGSGPGWASSAAYVVLAVRGEQVAASPLYDLVASAFTLLPVGEPGFRLGVLGALLGAATLAGVVAASRALLPKDPAAAVIAAILLYIAPPFRDAAAFATPSILAAAGTTWAIALAIHFARTRDTRDGVGALAACVLVIGSAPWLGAVLAIVVGIYVARAGLRRDVLAIVAAATGLAIALVWLPATGTLPGLAGSAAHALASSGRGAAAIVLGAGLVGISFAALTGLPHARVLAIVVVIAIVHHALVGSTTPVLLAVFAIGAAIVPSAIVRAAASSTEGLRRHLITLAAGVPLVAVAALIGATWFSVDDPGDEPARLAHDLVDAVPPGAGVFVATRTTTWLALQHEMTVAGARPDLALVPPMPAEQGDAIVANALRGERIVGADVAAFGRLDVRRAIPRGRGFQLVGDIPAPPPAVPSPASYASQTGREQAILLALERARYEAASGRLDAAARAAGLEQRFGAADLAILGGTVPSKDRPALFGFLPIARAPVAPWMLDAFGDDLAWVAGIDVPALDASAPIARRLHAKWRAILSGTATPDDPDIAALGDDAVRATKQLFTKAPE